MEKKDGNVVLSYDKEIETFLISRIKDSFTNEQEVLPVPVEDMISLLKCQKLLFNDPDMPWMKNNDLYKEREEEGQISFLQ